MTAPPTTTFNLVDEPWIRVRTTSGRVEDRSLRSVLDDAASIRALAGEIPTQDAAILRVLLAVLLGSVRSDDGLSEDEALDLWLDWWHAGRFPDAVGAYLDAVRPRFDLVDADAPFFQVAGLTTASGRASGLGKLIAEVPDGAPYFTTRTGPEVESLSLAEAARWLVHCQAFDPSGIKTGAVGDDRVRGGKGYPFGYPAWAGNLGLVIAEGASLFATLLYNLPLTRSGPHDLPQWERRPVGPGVDVTHPAPQGPADMFTWPSRRLRLMLSGDRVVDVQISNGDKLGPQDKHPFEPMSAWRYSKNQSSKTEQVLMPVMHSPSRRVWQGLGALLVPGATETPALKAQTVEWLATLRRHRLLEAGRIVDLRIVGFEYGTQNSTIDGAIDDRLAAPVAALTDRVLAAAAVDAAERATRGVVALANLASNLDRAAGGEGEAPREATFQRGYALLDAPYRRWIRSLDDPALAETKLEEWSGEASDILRRAGDALVLVAGPAAWTGREVSRLGSESPTLLDAGLAGIWFHAALNKALPRPTNNPEETTK